MLVVLDSPNTGATVDSDDTDHTHRHDPDAAYSASHSHHSEDIGHRRGSTKMICNEIKFI